MSEEIDYLVCRNCESPCYVFEVDAKGTVASAFCSVCGADGPAEFRVPDLEELEPD